MRSIPHISDPLKYLPASFIQSEFVEIRSDSSFDVKMMYVVNGMENAEEQCFVRKEVFERLKDAAAHLPEGYRLRILDAWRPFDLQMELFQKYSDQIIKDFGLEDMAEDDQKFFIAKFVSVPAPDKDVPPVHTTGGAVDLTILGPDGNELDMGSGFDEFSQRSYTDYYENNESGEHFDQIRENRRLLYHLMTDAGFTNLPSEWWHFDYGDRFWAYYMKQDALYRGVFTRGEFNGN